MSAADQEIVQPQRAINTAVCLGIAEDEEEETARGGEEGGNLNRGLQQICRV